MANRRRILDDLYYFSLDIMRELCDGCRLNNRNVEAHCCHFPEFPVNRAALLTHLRDMSHDDLITLSIDLISNLLIRYHSHHQSRPQGASPRRARDTPALPDSTTE